MRTALLAAPAALLLVISPGCAPEEMVTSAVPASLPLPSAVATVAADSESIAQAEAASHVPSNGWVDVPVDTVAYSEAYRLDAVSESFGDYAEEVLGSRAGADGCTTLGVSVMSTHPTGYVLGTVSTDCGGGQAVWHQDPRTDAWQLTLMLQATPACAELSAAALPPGAGLICLTPDGEPTHY